MATSRRRGMLFTVRAARGPREPRGHARKFSSVERRHRKRCRARWVGVVHAMLLSHQRLAEPRPQRRDLACGERPAQIRPGLVLRGHDSGLRTGRGVRSSDHVEHDLKPLGCWCRGTRRWMSTGRDPVVGMVIAPARHRRRRIDHVTSISSTASRGQERLQIPLKADRRRQIAVPEIATGPANSDTGTTATGMAAHSSTTDSAHPALPCSRGSARTDDASASGRATHPLPRRAAGGPGRSTVGARGGVVSRGNGRATGSVAGRSGSVR
jgi:hypothetical protein